MRMKKGFTLVEIMIVVGIIALLASIAIPSLLRARLNANESATIATLKTVVGSASSYASVSNGFFPPHTNAMVTAVPPYMDGSLDDQGAGGPIVRNGFTSIYTVNAVAGNNVGFHVYATPLNVGTTGNRDFYVDEGGTVYAAVGGTGNPSHAGGGAPTGNWSAVQ